jgi:hypothetical protein
MDRRGELGGVATGRSAWAAWTIFLVEGVAMVAFSTMIVGGVVFASVEERQGITGGKHRRPDHRDHDHVRRHRLRRLAPAFIADRFINVQEETEEKEDRPQAGGYSSRGGRLAQLGERSVYTRKVTGSSPVPPISPASLKHRGRQSPFKCTATAIGLMTSRW